MQRPAQPAPSSEASVAVYTHCAAKHIHHKSSCQPRAADMPSRKRHQRQNPFHEQSLLKLAPGRLNPSHLLDVTLVLHLPAANLKLTFPTAIAVQQLAWSLVASPDVYNDAGLSLRARDNLAWAADYLVACRAQGNSSLITQVAPSGWQAGCCEHQH